MKSSANYRIVDRRKFAAIMVVLLSIVAIVVWLGLDQVAEYWEYIEELSVAELHEAAALVRQLVRTFAIVNGIVLSAFAILIIWHGYSGRRTESMPPKGSWILDGQRTWSGESAVRIANFTMAVGVILGVLAVFSTLFFWNLVDAVVDQAFVDPCIPCHELHEPAFGQGRLVS